MEPKGPVPWDPYSPCKPHYKGQAPESPCLNGPEPSGVCGGCSLILPLEDVLLCLRSDGGLGQLLERG